MANGESVVTVSIYAPVIDPTMPVIGFSKVSLNRNIILMRQNK